MGRSKKNRARNKIATQTNATATQSNNDGREEGQDNTTDKSHDEAKKRLFVCCDGTWQDAANNMQYSTNVARFARCIDRLESRGYTTASGKKDHIIQVVWYSSGVGTSDNLPMRIDSLWSGISGSGFTEKILSAYYFLSSNYNLGYKQDDIILVGFSRGAFIVRCLAKFISEVGLLRRVAQPFLGLLFKLWLGGEKEELDELRKMLRSEKAPDGIQLLHNVRIKVLAEFDPVSAIFDRSNNYKGIASMQDEVPSNVDNAFLAMALNEKRSDFKPMLWKTKLESTKVVRQCAFLGCHADIGGGNEDSGLSQLPLLWMVAQVQEATSVKMNGSDGVQFDKNLLLQFATPASASFYEGKLKVFTLSEGKITESLIGHWKSLYAVKGMFKPGQRAIDRELPSEEETQCPLEIHFSIHMLHKRDEINPDDKPKDRDLYPLGPLKDPKFGRRTEKPRVNLPGATWEWDSVSNSTIKRYRFEEKKPDRREIRLLGGWVDKAKLWWARNPEMSRNAEEEDSNEDEDERGWRNFINEGGVCVDFESDKEQTLVHFFDTCFEKKLLYRVKSEDNEGEKTRKRTKKSEGGKTKNNQPGQGRK